MQLVTYICATCGLAVEFVSLASYGAHDPGCADFCIPEFYCWHCKELWDIRAFSEGYICW